MEENDPYDTIQIEKEANILRTIQFACTDGVDEFNIVRYNESFRAGAHMCLVFEKLEQSLFDYHELHNFEPLPTSFLQPITEQLLKALSKLKSIGVVHADMKIQNIMIVNSTQVPCRIKLIDLGLAHYTCHIRRERETPYIQTRYYR